MKTSKNNLVSKTKDTQPNQEKVVDKNDIKTLLGKGYNIKVVSRGGSSVVHADGIAMIDYDSRDQQNNIHIWRQIHTAIYKTLDNHPKIRYESVNGYSTKKPIKVMDKVTYVDISHCYLQVANKLGYINDEDYSKILSQYSKTKIEVCASITSLFRETKCDYYNKKGRVDRTIECNNYFLEDAQNNIINFSRKIMLDYCRTGMDYYNRTIDGLVVPQEDRELIIGYIKECGFKYKEVTGAFLGNGLIMRKSDGIIVDCL